MEKFTACPFGIPSLFYICMNYFAFGPPSVLCLDFKLSIRHYIQSLNLQPFSYQPRSITAMPPSLWPTENFMVRTFYLLPTTDVSGSWFDTSWFKGPTWSQFFQPCLQWKHPVCGQTGHCLWYHGGGKRANYSSWMEQHLCLIHLKW